MWAHQQERGQHLEKDQGLSHADALHEADEAGEVVREEHAAEAPPVVLWMMWCQHDPG